MKLRLTIGLIVAAGMQPAFAQSCAPILKAADTYAKAERFAVKMKIVSKGETHETEVMMAPEGMFIRGGGQWIRSPVSINRKDLLDSTKSTFTDCSRIGQETIDGVPTSIHRFTGKAEGQPPMQGKIWIGMADNLPRRMEGKNPDTDIVQAIRYDVEAPTTGVLGVPGLNQLKGLFTR
jgi:hypothetical protein